MEFMYHNTSMSTVIDIIRNNITESETPAKLSLKLLPTDALYGGICENIIWLQKTSWYFRQAPQRYFSGKFEARDGNVILSGEFRHSVFSVVLCIFEIFIMCALCIWSEMRRHETLLQTLDSQFVRIGCGIIIVGSLALFSAGSSLYRKEERFVIDFLEKIKTCTGNTGNGSMC